jgi:hypothetical protein
LQSLQMRSPPRMMLPSTGLFTRHTQHQARWLGGMPGPGVRSLAMSRAWLPAGSNGEPVLLMRIGRFMLI